MDFSAALKEESEVVDAKFDQPPMSLEAVKPSFLPYLNQVDDMAEEAKALTVNDEKSMRPPSLSASVPRKSPRPLKRSARK